jgi:hypothetical protein
MQVRGDIERVNMSTGERFQRVSGNGESRLESLGRPLNEAELACLNAFADHMQNEVIPDVIQTMRRRAEVVERNRHRILY